VTREGVIRFDLTFTKALSPPASDVAGLVHWHKKLHALELIGQDPARYDGYAYGNLSCRHESGGFIISASQTGGKTELDAGDFCRVTSWDIDKNSVIAEGPQPPSSESLTHAMLYRLDPDIAVVFHVHAPKIWRNAEKLGLAITASDIPYGTPGMAHEVARLFGSAETGQMSAFSMGGHEDGIISFAASFERAGNILLDLAERSEAI